MKNQTIFITTKRICTLLLFISFFLPMVKSCSKVEIPNTTEQPLISWVDETPETKYIWNILPSNTPLRSQLLLLALIYFWPIPFLLLSGIQRSFFHYLRIGAELFLGSLGSYFYVLITVFQGKLMIGAYLYLLAAAIYLGVTLLELGQRIFSHIRGPKKLICPTSAPEKVAD